LSYPLAPQQARIWHLRQRSPDYVSRILVEGAGPLDLPMLQAALTATVDQVDSFRACFAVASELGIPMQSTGAAGPVPLHECEAETREAARRAFEAEEVRDDGQDPLPIRAQVWRCHEAGWLLGVDASALRVDGPGMELFARALTDVYGQLGRGEQPALQMQPYLPVAGWLASLWNSEDAAPMRDHWAAFADDVDLARLLTQRLPGATASGAASGIGTLRLRLTDRLSAALVRLAGRSSQRLEAVCLAAWQALLAARSGEERVVVGVGSPGRSDEEIAGVVGLLHRHLPVCGSVGKRASLAEMADEVDRALSTARLHEDGFFWDRALHPALDADAHLPFGFEYADAWMRWARTDRFDLLLACRLDGAGLELRLDYDRSAVSHDDAVLVAAAYQALVEAAVDDERMPVDELPMVGADERRTVLRRASAEPADVESPSFVESFLEQARRRGEATAVITAQRRVSYAELHRGAAALAAELERRQVTPGTAVAVLAQAPLARVTAMWATFLRGAAYVPLDSSHPPARNLHVVCDAGCRLLLTDTPSPAVERLAQDAGIPMLPIEQAPAAAEPAGWWGSVPPQHPAYVIYTSGTTGRPKGVAVSYGSFDRHVPAAVAAFAFDDQDVVLQFASASFDLSLEQCVAPLTVGAALMVTDQQTWEPAEMDRRIRAHGVTFLPLPPAYAEELFTLWAASDEALPARLRLVNIGGDVLSPRLLARWRGLRTGATRLVNGYGPTEAAVTATVADVDTIPAPSPESRAVAIGRPLRGRTVYVLDETGRVVPHGRRGELCLGGDCLALGYVGQPAQTAERFVPNPFSERPGARLYRTGDTVRFLRDGSLEFLGRLDNQVKVRGQRVELEEIEAVLQRHPGVRAACVGLELEPAEPQLRAYVELVAGTRLTEDDLRSFVALSVPRHMVPQAIMEVASLPRGSSGKVSRQALAGQGRRLGVAAHVEPTTALQRTVADVWSEVLQVASVGLDADFFELGGHSLKAVQIASRLSRQLATGVRITDLFQHPSVRRLSQYLEGRAAAGVDAVPAVVHADFSAEHPLSHAQQRLWFIDQLLEGDAPYVVPMGFRLRGPIDEAAFVEAWRHLVRRHAVMRTVFREREGRPMAVVQDEVRFDVPVLDLTDRAPADADAELRELTGRDQTIPFSLTEGPLLRVWLVRLPDARHYCYINMHHIVTDVWSLAVMVRDLEEFYTALAAGRCPDLPAPAYDYADYVRWEAEMTDSAQWREQERLLRAELADPPPPLALPLDFPRFDIQRYHGDEVWFEADAEIVALQAEAGQRLAVSSFMLCLSAYFIWLRHVTRQDDLVVGFPVAARTRPELEGIVGFMVNTMAVRIDMRRCEHTRELLAMVRDKTLRAFECQAYPFDLLVQRLNPERTLDRAALFDTTFAMQEMPTLSPGTGAATSDLLWTWDESAERTSKFDLSVTAAEVRNRLLLSMTYNTELFRRTTVESFADQYLIVLRRLLADLCR
jgi:amino acid adenylation domain-containing protein